MNSEIMKCEDPLYVVTGTPQMVRFLCDQAIVLLQCLSKIYKKSIHLEALKPSSHLQTSLSMGGMLHCAAVHTALLQELLNFVQKLWSSFLIIKPSSSSHSKSSMRPCTRFLKCFILNILCSKKNIYLASQTSYKTFNDQNNKDSILVLCLYSWFTELLFLLHSDPIQPDLGPKKIL